MEISNKKGHQNPRFLQTGLQLIELLIGIAIIGVLISVVTPLYTNFLKKGDETKTVQDINTISFLIEDFYLTNSAYPDSLTEVSMGGMKDPWGNPYQYLRINGGHPSSAGHSRKDHALVPINTDYDLYSKGEDGRSTAPLTANHSKDDIVRANNGKYIGLAEDY